jgi:hypothetical protein
MKLIDLFEAEEEPVNYVLERLDAIIEGPAGPLVGAPAPLPPGTRVQKIEEQNGRTYAWRVVPRFVGVDSATNQAIFKTAGAFSCPTEEYNKKVGTKRDWDKKFLDSLKEEESSPQPGDIYTLKVDSAIDREHGGSTFFHAGTKFEIVRSTNWRVIFKLPVQPGTYAEMFSRFPTIMFKGTSKEWHENFLKSLKSDD